jgi:hypothetical protein
VLSGKQGSLLTSVLTLRPELAKALLDELHA